MGKKSDLENLEMLVHEQGKEIKKIKEDVKEIEKFTGLVKL